MNMTVEDRPIEQVLPYERNPRVNDTAVDAVAASIKEFGFRTPILCDGAGVIIAGHTRLKAALKLWLNRPVEPWNQPDAFIENRFERR